MRMGGRPTYLSGSSRFRRVLAIAALRVAVRRYYRISIAMLALSRQCDLSHGPQDAHAYGSTLVANAGQPRCLRKGTRSLISQVPGGSTWCVLKQLRLKWASTLGGTCVHKGGACDPRAVEIQMWPWIFLYRR